jgi:hypothetical protein
MDSLLKEIAQKLKNSDKKVQLIYAYNSTGKTRLSQEFKWLIESDDNSDVSDESDKIFERILYYNAFTEDLFYWDNNMENYFKPRLKIHPNSFTKWIFTVQGQDRNIISNFQHYTNNKLMPHFNEEYTLKNNNGETIKVEAFTEITFSYERGNEENLNNIKISKGEESLFIWCVFYSLIEQVIDILNVAEPSDRETNQFDQLEYVFIDDPVSSLDENNLIELAVNLAELINSSESELKFIVTTHNPLFYNVLYHELKKLKKYFLKKNEDGKYELYEQPNDSPFSYHLFLKNEIEKAIETGQIKKYHFNFLRNILEKTATFLGYDKWKDLIPDVKGAREAYARRLNLYSHSKHSGYEAAEITDEDKRVLNYLMNKIKETYRFK